MHRAKSHFIVACLTAIAAIVSLLFSEAPSDQVDPWSITLLLCSVFIMLAALYELLRAVAGTLESIYEKMCEKD